MKRKAGQVRCQRCGLPCTLLTSDTVYANGTFYRLCHRATHSCWIEVMVMGKPLEDGNTVRDIDISPDQLVIPGMEDLVG